MAFSLIHDSWIPVRRLSGARATIRPAALTNHLSDDPIVAVDWPRPDFRLASLEFLIGLLATAHPPTDHEAWIELWESPPAPAVLDAAFEPLTPAFELDGDGPRFMQDFDDLDGTTNRVAGLLIDAPGDNTIRRNTDILVKRGRVAVLCRASAAMALFTLQAYAPSGGAGNRTSLRGGGPLTTLAIPPDVAGATPPLWHMLWANVPEGEKPVQAEHPRVFPWLMPTRVSDKSGCPTTPADAHPLQAFWAMPRRIRLHFADNIEGRPCDITGGVDPTIITSWRQKPWGASYERWMHPLSPYYRQKPTDTEWLPIHPQPSGIGYRHWLGLVVSPSDPAALKRVAATVATYRRDRHADIAAGRTVPWRLIAGGYDMDNMKARGFVESEMPVLEPGDQHAREALESLIVQLIGAAGEVAGLLGRAVRRALFSEQATLAPDVSSLASLRESFWAMTQPGFFDAVEATAGGADAATIRADWLVRLRRTALDLFAEAAPIDATGADRRPDRIASAVRQLGLALAGYGKDGAALFDKLGLARLEMSPTRKPRSRTA